MSQMQIRGSTQILAGTIPASAFVSSLALPTSQLAQGSLFLTSTGTVAMTAPLNMGGYTAINGGSPVNSTDLVIKSYVDGLINGFSIHPLCLVMSTTNVSSLSGLQTIDGVVLAVGNRVLLTGQTTGSQNGPWVAESGAWTRPTDWYSGEVLSGAQYFILSPSGTTYKNTKWYCTNTGNITVDTTATVFTQDLSGTSYSNGSGLSLTGTTFAVKTGNGLGFDGSNNVQIVPNGTSLNVSSSGIQISNGIAGQVMVAGTGGAAGFATMSGDASMASNGAITLATVASAGTYGSVTINAKGLAIGGSPICGVTNGGTGASSLTGVIKGNGTSAMTAATAGVDYSAGTSSLATGIVKSTTSTGALSIATAGVDFAPPTSGASLLYGNGSGGFSNVTTGTGISFTGGVLSTTTSGGSVTTASVVSANGFAGTVANSTTTPAITLTTTISGMLKGSSSALVAATGGVDYSVGTSGLATGILKSTSGTGALTIAAAGDFPILNQNTTGNAATVTTIPALTGDVTSSGSSNVTTVNSTAGSGFTKYPSFIAAEIVSGVTNGTNTTFTLANTPQWLQFYQNGQLLEPGSGNDFTISGNTITMLIPPISGDKLLAWYLK